MLQLWRRLAVCGGPFNAQHFATHAKSLAKTDVFGVDMVLVFAFLGDNVVAGRSVVNAVVGVAPVVFVFGGSGLVALPSAVLKVAIVGNGAVVIGMPSLLSSVGTDVGA